MIEITTLRRMALTSGACVAFALALAHSAAADPDIPLGPVGGTCAPVPGTGLVKILTLETGGPGDAAGLLPGDFIRGAEGTDFGTTSTNTGDGYVGAIQDLAMAIDRAEGGSGQITLNVIRSGTGGTDVSVNVGTAGALGPAWPAGSAKAGSIYERCCADIHSLVQSSSSGNFGYDSGWFGMILLSHPNWNDTSGATPYRNSIDKLRTRCEDYLNDRVLEPAEKYYWNGSDVVDNPAYVSAGLENWDICTSSIFLALYRMKTGDTSADAVVQRAAEMIAHRIQTWIQYDDPGEPHVLGGRIGRMGHGGVHGDYSHYNGIGALNIINAHALPAMALLKMAGADMSKNLGRSINSFDYDTEKLTPTIEEKFRYCWNMVRNATTYNDGSDDGNVGYVGRQSGWDSAGRTPGSFAGWNLYGMAPDATDTDRLARQAAYIPRRWYRQQHSHAYTIGGVVLSQMAMPFLSDRQERFFQENTRLYAELERQPDGSVAYFPGRQNNGGDSYLDYTRVGLINAAMPEAVRSGNLPGFPAPNPARILAWMRSPANSWPALEARRVNLAGGLSHTLDIDITDADGAILDPADYTASWTHISGPGTVVFGSPDSAGTSVSFPQAGTYRVELEVVRSGYTLTEPYDLAVVTDTPPAGVPPYVVIEPVPQSADQGDTVTFTVDAQGTAPLIYQWRQNGVEIGGPSTAPNYTIESVSAGSAGNYDCVITNAHGTATSTTATLTVHGVGHFHWGGLWRDVFTGVSGSHVSDLTDSPNFPNFPDASGAIANAESPTGYGDNYGQRWSGWITPPETGSYRFYIATDDNSELWLSTTDKRADRVLIAKETHYRHERDWPSSTSDESASPSISMVGGQRYYIELLHKEGSGGDNAAITWNWKSPGIWSAPADGSEPLPGAVLEYQVGGTLDDNATPPADYPPVAHDQSIVIYGGATTTVTLTGEDFETPTASLSYTVTGSPTKGALSGTAPNLTYTPNGGASGTDSFTFKINDGGQDSADATVTISLIPESGGDLKVWNGSNDNLWTADANWEAGTTPDSGDAVIFNAASTSNLSTSLHIDKSIARIVVENPAGAVTIADNTLTLSGGIEMRSATQDLTISSELAIGSAQEWSVGKERTLVSSGAISGSSALTKTGEGTLSLQKVSPMSGGLVVDEGTLELDGGGWYDGYVGGAGMLTVNEGAIAINVKSHAFGSSSNPSRDLTLNGGRFRLRKETYIDDIYMTAGTIDNTPGSTSDLRARSGNSTVVRVYAADTPSVIACPFNFYSNAMFDVADGPAAPDLLVSGPLAGGSTCTKNGPGSMTLSGNSTHTGPLNIAAGSVAVTGSLDETSVATVQSGAALEGTGHIQGFVSNGGTVSPGVGGAVAVLSVGTYEQLSGASTKIELNGTTAGSGHDQLAVTRSATLAGTLDITLAPGFTPEAGDSFVVVSYGSRTGAFDAINLPPLPDDRKWVTAYDPDGISGLSVSVDPIPAFTQWQTAQFGVHADNPAIAGESADPDHDGIVNLMEYALNLDPNIPLANGGAPGHAGLPAIDAGAPENFAMIYRRNLAATDVTYTVEESNDLGKTDPWSQASVTETILSDDGQTRVIRAAVPAGAAPRKFLRLKVEK